MTSHSFKDNYRVVKVVLTAEDSKLPMYAKPGDAGADVSVIKCPDTPASYIGLVYWDEKMNPCIVGKGDWVIPNGATKMLDLGLKIELRPGWEMQVRSRSGMAKRGLVVANAPGTIDSGYRGPCMVLLHNNTQLPRVIRPGTRVAQFVLKRAPRALFDQVKELNDSDRGEGGFGSTGTN